MKLRGSFDSCIFGPFSAINLSPTLNPPKMKASQGKTKAKIWTLVQTASEWSLVYIHACIHTYIYIYVHIQQGLGFRISVIANESAQVGLNVPGKHF